MQVYLVKTVIGVFALDEKKKVLSFKPFSKNPNEIADKLLEKEPMEYQQIRHELKGSDFITDDRTVEDFVKENLRKYALHYNFVKNQVEFNLFLADVSLEISKRKIKQTVGKDNIVIHINNAIEEIDKSLNIFIERLREWYSLHFPEMDRVVADHKRFAEIVERFGSMKKIEDKELRQLAQKSIGMDFSEDDIKIVQIFSGEILRLYSLKDELTKHLEKILKIVAPNFTELAGATIAAKLISKAGSMEKLARMPSSTIQLLGAEKALFKFLHGEGRSPRFGIIYSHTLIQNSPEKLKGRIARVLASKLSIAAKMDYYSKEYKGEQLKTELGKKVKAILSG